MHTSGSGSCFGAVESCLYLLVLMSGVYNKQRSSSILPVSQVLVVVLVVVVLLLVVVVVFSFPTSQRGRCH